MSAFYLPERIENVWQHPQINAGPAIADQQRSIAAFRLCHHPYPATRFHVLDGIVQEIRQDLLKLRWVRFQEHGLRRQDDFKMVAALGDERAHRLDRANYHLLQIQKRFVQLDLAMFDMRNLAHILDEAIDGLHPPAHQVLDPISLGWLVSLHFEDLQSVADRAHAAA
jgi:hypothetical protein